MRYRRRRRETLSPRRKRYAELMDRASIRSEVLSCGIGEAIKRGPDIKGLRVILDMAVTELIPEMLRQDLYFNKAYPDRPQSANAEESQAAQDSPEERQRQKESGLT